MAPMAGSWLFAYGSLVNRASAARALGRLPSPAELVPAELAGYRLAWSSRQRVYVEATGQMIDAAFLNLEPAPHSAAQGLLIPVSGDELERVAKREKGYRCIDVGTGIRAAVALQAPVHAFMSPPPADAMAGCCLLDGYLDKVRQGWREFDADRLARFDREAVLPPLPRVAGPYRFVDPEQRQLT
jgi:hypothetical protein